MQIEAFRGARIAAIVPALARLRVAVFRDWPYLYEGDPESERIYLETYARSASAVVFVAFDGVDPVGASTCVRMSEETANIVEPARAAGWNPDRVCYFGESVLLPAYRGRGVGVRFFALREAQAMALECDMAAFCAIERPADHPARPAGAVALDDFWRRRGFVRHPEILADFVWQERGEDEPSTKRMVFWSKALR